MKYRIIKWNGFWYVEKKGFFGWRSYIRDMRDGEPWPFDNEHAAILELSRHQPLAIEVARQ
jgi:hypothetical protein